MSIENSLQPDSLQPQHIPEVAHISKSERLWLAKEV
jgi:hypothetical protein